MCVILHERVFFTAFTDDLHSTDISFCTVIITLKFSFIIFMVLLLHTTVLLLTVYVVFAKFETVSDSFQKNPILFASLKPVL